MKILDEHSRWWKGIEKEWAVEDKDGNWWIYRNEDEKDKKDMKIKKRKRKEEFSLRPSTNFYLLVLLAVLLGVSLASNVVYYLM